MGSRKLSTYTRDEFAERKQLGQKTPAVSNVAEEIYSPAEGIEMIGFMMMITNDSNQDRTGTVYQDHDGSTYDKTTKLMQRTVTRGGDSLFEGYAAMNNSAGSMGVESSTGGDLTFTLWGIERPKK